jgi:PEP-CTERM motif
VKNKKIVQVVIALFAICVLPAMASAAPIWNAGNECPTDAQVSADPTLTRQYSITQATNCVFDTADDNITGTNDEANAYLNAPPAPAVWGTGWVGLGQESQGNDIAGFSFTADAGNDDGTFLINTLILNFSQFAVGIKDGGDPRWAIFLLPAGTFSGDWHFLPSDGPGDLSHFALYGRNVSPPGGGDDPTPAPEPATLILLGTGLGVAATRARNRNKRRA